VYTLLRTVGDAGLWPFAWLPDTLAVAALSVALGLLFLVLFRLVTPARRVRRVKELMSACVYEMRLFAARPALVLAAQLRALGWTGVYLVLALPALLLLFPPTAALLARGATRYEHRPLRPGEVTLASVTLSRPGQVRVTAADDGLEIVPPLVTVRSQSAAFVRVKALRPGEHRLRIQVAGGAALDKSVRVAAHGRGPVSLYREAAPTWRTLLGHEPVLPGGAVQRIAVDYPRETLHLLGLAWYWVVVLLSLVTAFALRRRLGVVF